MLFCKPVRQVEMLSSSLQINDEPSMWHLWVVASEMKYTNGWTNTIPPKYVFILKSVRVALKSTSHLQHIRSSLSLSVCLSVLIYQRVSVKFNMGNFHENLLGKSEFG